MKLQPILILEIYDMVAYKKCLNTEVDVHIRSSSCWNWYKEEARNHNSYDKNVLILFWEEMEIFASFCEARDWTLYWLSWISKVSAFFLKKLKCEQRNYVICDNWKEYILFNGFSTYVSLDECRYFELVMDSPPLWYAIL